jgi:hypothetical protein
LDQTQTACSTSIKNRDWTSTTLYKKTYKIKQNLSTSWSLYPQHQFWTLSPKYLALSK